MRELIIGSSGFIGGALSKLIPSALVTGRDTLDLLTIRRVPQCDIAYLCAGVNGAKPCEGSADAFRANVDAPIYLANHFRLSGAFMVFISSMSIEWAATNYARQKLTAETVLRTLPNVGIVRAGRVTLDNVADLCEQLMETGRARKAGLTRWGTDDIAYKK